MTAVRSPNYANPFDFPQAPVVPAQRIAVVPGEGIGPSLVDQAISILNAASEASTMPVVVEFAPERVWSKSRELRAHDEFGQFYQACFAKQIPVLHGPAGGRFVHELRAAFALDIKLTPVAPHPAIADASLLRPERVGGADVLLVRDNSGGLYQGHFGWRDGRSVAFQEASYRRSQVHNVVSAALRLASVRSKRLTVVTKPGGLPTISALWHEIAVDLTRSDRALHDTELSFMEIDNACFQLGSAPRQFDVMVSPNMFGDVLGDTAAITLGSRGMSYSANFSAQGAAVYQTGHGAAHDLAGRDIANPLGQILSLCWMLRTSLRRDDLASKIEQAIAQVLAEGFRTADIAGPTSMVVSTSELGARIVSTLRESSGANSTSELTKPDEITKPNVFGSSVL
jgi:3-isopropylmalate dehydrogenase